MEFPIITVDDYSREFRVSPFYSPRSRRLMKKRDGAGVDVRARRYAFYAQKPASAWEGRTGGAAVRYAGSARTINYLLIPSKKPVQVRPSRHTDATAPARCTRTHPHGRPRGRCFIDIYDGTLSGRSCFKPQRDLTEKRHTHTLRCIYDSALPEPSIRSFICPFASSFARPRISQIQRERFAKSPIVDFQSAGTERIAGGRLRVIIGGAEARLDRMIHSRALSTTLTIGFLRSPD